MGVVTTHAPAEARVPELCCLSYTGTYPSYSRICALITETLKIIFWEDTGVPWGAWQSWVSAPGMSLASWQHHQGSDGEQQQPRGPLGLQYPQRGVPDLHLRVWRAPGPLLSQQEGGSGLADSRGCPAARGPVARPREAYTHSTAGAITWLLGRGLLHQQHLGNIQHRKFLSVCPQKT